MPFSMEKSEDHSNEARGPIAAAITAHKTRLWGRYTHKVEQNLSYRLETGSQHSAMHFFVA